MRTVIILSCLFGIALCVPVVKRDTYPIAAPPSPVQATSSDLVELSRKRRQLFEIDIFNNGGGYYGNGYGGYGGYGGYPGYGGFGGGYGGYGGYGGFGGYPGYGGFGGFPGYGGFGGFF